MSRQAPAQPSGALWGDALSPRHTPKSSPNYSGSWSTSSSLLRAAPGVPALRLVWPSLCGDGAQSHGKRELSAASQVITATSCWRKCLCQGVTWDKDGVCGFNASTHFWTKRMFGDMMSSSVLLLLLTSLKKLVQIPNGALQLPC